MNIEHAKTIPLSAILDKINCKPVRQSDKEAWYLSPLRNEKTASFHVHRHKNIWFDFGLSKGGNVIDFVCAYLASINENDTLPDALRWLKYMMGYAPMIANVARVGYMQPEEKLILKDVSKIQHPALIHYLEKRGISLDIAQTVLKQTRIYNCATNKTFFSLGLKNEAGGYELRNPFFKGSVGKKSISFIRGTRPKPDGVNFFEGSMDYLSIIANQKGKKMEDDTIILNSLTLIKKATPYINEYGYKFGYTWLDNDETGKRANKALADFFKTQESLEHLPMNEFYEPYKDVNAWYMAKLGLGA